MAWIPNHIKGGKIGIWEDKKHIFIPYGGDQIPPDVLREADVVDDLEHTDTDKPLSDNQGKVLYDKIKEIGLYVGKSNTFAGLPNKRPDNTVLIKNDTSILTDDDIGTGDADSPQYPKGVYSWNGTSWELQYNFSRDRDKIKDWQPNTNYGLNESVIIENDIWRSKLARTSSNNLDNTEKSNWRRVTYQLQSYFAKKTDVAPANQYNPTTNEIDNYCTSNNIKNAIVYYTGTDNSNDNIIRTFVIDHNGTSVKAKDDIVTLSTYINSLGTVRNGVEIIKTNDLSIDISDGSLYTINTAEKKIEKKTVNATTGITFRYLKPDNTDEGGDVTDIDPTQYYDNGTLTTVSMNRNATFQKLYIKEDGTEYRMHRGIIEYSTLDDASQQYMNEDVPFVDGYIFIGGFLLKKNTNDLSSNRVRRVYASKLGEIGLGTTDSNTGLRGKPVANISALKALDAKEYEIRRVKSNDTDYVFKLNADLTTEENNDTNNESDDAGTGKWILQKQSEGLRGKPVQDNTELTALKARDYERRKIKDSGEERVFLLGESVNSSLNDLQDDAHTGVWRLVKSETISTDYANQIQPNGTTGVWYLAKSGMFNTTYTTDQNKFTLINANGNNPLTAVNDEGIKEKSMFIKSSDKINISDNGMSLNKWGFFISAWVKLQRNGGGTDNIYIFGNKDSGNPSKALHIGWRDDTTFKVGFYGADVNITVGSPYKSSDIQNKWIHVAVRYDYSTQKSTVFINGQKIGEGTHSARYESNFEYIFGRFDTTTTNGKIAQLRIGRKHQADVNISDSEIQKMYQDELKELVEIK